MRFAVILLMLAIGIDSTMAFAKTCYLSDAVSTDLGNDKYFWFYNPQPFQVAFADNNDETLQTDFFRLHLVLDPTTHAIAYTFDDPDKDLSGRYVPEDKQIITDATSLDDFDQVSSETIQIAPAQYLRAEIRCTRE